MNSIFRFALRCVVVCLICFVQLMCVNSGVGWLTHIQIGLVALVVSVLTPTPFFWCVLIGYPLVLSWYSGLPVFVDSWVFAIIACVLWLIRTFFVKEQYFSVRFGFVVVATVLWYPLEALAFVALSRFGYDTIPTVSFFTILTRIAIATVLHTIVLAGWTMCERYVMRRR